MFTTISAAFVVALFVTAVYMSWRAINQSRTPQGAVGWVVFLLTAPYIAVPAYLFLGNVKFAGYVNARRDSAQVASGLHRLRIDHKSRIDPSRINVLALERLAGVPVVADNDMKLLIDGPETFGALFEAMDMAKSYILAQFYIIRNDDLGQELTSRLIARAKDGVRVRVLFDKIGSSRLSETRLGEMREAGIEIFDVHYRHAARNRFQINFRNHRKTLIVDGTTGFTGGLNVGDEYMGRSSRFGPWRDTFLRIEGPMVSQLQLCFAEDWFWATGEALGDQVIWEAGKAAANMDGIILSSGPGDDLETGSLYFCNLIDAARKRVWIATPYFIPDTDILTSLKLAAIRGVDTRILVPDAIDHRIPWLAAHAYFDEIREAGVKVYRYTRGFMHQKVLLVDADVASVGTINLDIRSCRLNFEATAIFLDTRAADRVAEMLKRDFANAFLLERALSEQGILKRIGAPVARLFSPVL